MYLKYNQICKNVTLKYLTRFINNGVFYCFKIRVRHFTKKIKSVFEMVAYNRIRTLWVSVKFNYVFCIEKRVFLKDPFSVRHIKVTGYKYKDSMF